MNKLLSLRPLKNKIHKFLSSKYSYGSVRGLCDHRREIISKSVSPVRYPVDTIPSAIIPQYLVTFWPRYNSFYVITRRSASGRLNREVKLQRGQTRNGEERERERARAYWNQSTLSITRPRAITHIAMINRRSVPLYMRRIPFYKPLITRQTIRW